jgi:hypothetical protein
MTARIEAGYSYYVRIEEGFTEERPLGLYRVPEGDLMEIEALGHNGAWHYSGALMVNVMTGEVDITEVSRETAEIALKNLLKNEKARANYK